MFPSDSAHLTHMVSLDTVHAWGQAVLSLRGCPLHCRGQFTPLISDLQTLRLILWNAEGGDAQHGLSVCGSLHTKGWAANHLPDMSPAFKCAKSVPRKTRASQLEWTTEPLSTVDMSPDIPQAPGSLYYVDLPFFSPESTVGIHWFVFHQQFPKDRGF